MIPADTADYRRGLFQGFCVNLRHLREKNSEAIYLPENRILGSFAVECFPQIPLITAEDYSRGSALICAICGRKIQRPFTCLKIEFSVRSQVNDSRRYR
jgi:hypothetical protein